MEHSVKIADQIHNLPGLKKKQGHQRVRQPRPLKQAAVTKQEVVTK